MSVSTPAAIRPTMPPTVVPLTYSPIASPKLPGWNSSPTYAIAMEGNPASATPCSARRANKTEKLGLKEISSANMAEQNSDKVIMVFRLRDSESVAATSMNTARVPVASDSDRLDTADVTPNCLEKTGIKGCTL